MKVLFPGNEFGEGDGALPSFVADQDFGSAKPPTFKLGSFHGVASKTIGKTLSKVSRSSADFKAAIESSSIGDPSPLLLFLVSSNYTSSPPPFGSSTLSNYLLNLKIISRLYLPTSDFSPLLLDLCLILSLPPCQGEAGCDLETLRPAAVLAAMCKILHGRSTTSVRFFARNFASFVWTVTCLSLFTHPHASKPPHPVHFVQRAAQDEFFVPSPSGKSHLSWIKTFSDLIAKLYPKTHAVMEKTGALSPVELSPIFERFFIPILPIDCVLRIFDIFLLEGSKAIFRFGVALIAMFKKRLKRVNFDSPNNHWWDKVKELTHEPEFSFNALVDAAYGFHGKYYCEIWRLPFLFSR